MSLFLIFFLLFFFFQAEDGIRDGHVTGVQTCALPISAWSLPDARRRSAPGRRPPRARSAPDVPAAAGRSEEHTSELQSRGHLVCRLLLEKKKKGTRRRRYLATSGPQPATQTATCTRRTR